MANKEKDNKKYSIDMLWDNISAQYVEEEDSNTDASHRDKLLKLKVIEHLINVVESVAEESEENRKDSIYLKLSKNDSLFGYSCFMASNSKFDYSWNYQRSQWDKYIETLEHISTFVLKMISCINLLQSKCSDFDNDIEFVFANLFVVSFQSEKHLATTNIIWENMEQIFSVKNGFTIIAKVGSMTLLSSFCTYKNCDLESFLGKITEFKIVRDTKDNGEA